MKNWYFPLVTGCIFLVIGICLLLFPLNMHYMLFPFFGIGFIVSGLSRFIFSLSNRSIMVDWLWHTIYGIIIFSMGCYIEIYLNSTSSFSLDLVLLFYSCVLLGTYFDIKKISNFKQNNLRIATLLGVGLSIVHIFSPIIVVDNFKVCLISIVFIVNGISNILFSLIFRRFGIWEKQIKMI